jgi:hypothetical protein
MSFLESNLTESFTIKDYLYIGGIVLTGVVTFITTRHKIKEYVRDKFDELRGKQYDQELKIQKLESKDDLQQQVIDEIRKQTDNLIPLLLDALKHKKHGSE